MLGIHVFLVSFKMCSHISMRGFVRPSVRPTMKIVVLIFDMRSFYHDRCALPGLFSKLAKQLPRVYMRNTGFTLIEMVSMS